MKIQTAIRASVVALVILLTTGCAAELQSQTDAPTASVDALASAVARAQSSAALTERNPKARAISARVGGMPASSMNS